MPPHRRPARPRKRAHIERGERAFIPPERLREVRWEESIAYAQAKRAGLDDYKLQHIDCHCGSVSCLCTPILMRWSENEQRWVPAHLSTERRVRRGRK